MTRVLADQTQYDTVIKEKLRKFVCDHIICIDTMDKTRGYSVYMLSDRDVVGIGFRLFHTDFDLPEKELLTLIDRYVDQCELMLGRSLRSSGKSLDDFVSIPYDLYRVLTANGTIKHEEHVK